MNTAGAHLGPAIAIVKRDFLTALSYRVGFITGLIGAFVSLTTFYYISRLVRLDGLSPASYFAFVAIGICIYQILLATLTAPHQRLRQELMAGTFERILLAPGGPVASILALMIYPALYALLTVAALLCFAGTVFGVDLQWSTVPLGLPLAVLGLLAFAPFGVLLQAAVIVGKQAPPGTNYIIAGITLIAGLYFPVTLLPEWIQWASEVQPFTPAVDLLRWAFAGQSLTDPAWLDMTKLVGFALVAMPLSMAALAAALRLSRRRGTILEF